MVSPKIKSVLKCTYLSQMRTKKQVKTMDLFVMSFQLMMFFVVKKCGDRKIVQSSSKLL